MYKGDGAIVGWVRGKTFFENWCDDGRFPFTGYRVCKSMMVRKRMDRGWTIAASVCR